MQKGSSNIRIGFGDKLAVLLNRIVFVIALYTITRLLFLCFNYWTYEPKVFSEYLKSLFFGVRFDISIIYYSNIVFILLSLVPFHFTSSGWYQKVLKVLFVLVNGLLLLINIIDIGYYPILKSRSTWSVYTTLFSDPSTPGLLTSYVLRYWYLSLFGIGIVYMLIKYYPVLRVYSFMHRIKGVKNALFLSILPLFILGGGFAIARGIQGMPLRLVSANDYVRPEYSSLVLNTPFSLVNTMGHSPLVGHYYMPFGEAEKLYTPVKKYENGAGFTKKNVVVIILESFGAEYVFEHKSPQSFTPFIDSLITKSLLCEYTISNSQNSRNALPAVLTSLYPVKWFNYMESQYALNKLRGLPEILKEEGYHTSFFHGGHNGTMSFDKVVKATGIDNYYGNDEYIEAKGDEAYDGAWGIYDDAFFTYTAEQLNAFQEPFFSSLFSLSSHDPYTVPNQLKGKFPKGKIPILKTVAYTDYSLRLFFNRIKNEPWYKNTLFVIVADHTSKNTLQQYRTIEKNFAIPLLFFAPGDDSLVGTYSPITQQADIMPSVLDYLGYSKSFVAWGNSIFDEDTYRFAVNCRGTTPFIADSLHALAFDGNKTLAMYNYSANKQIELREDSLSEWEDMENYFKAFIQNYEYRMIHNKLYDTLSVSEMILDEGIE